MKAELVNPFVNATVNVLTTMAQTKPTPGRPSLKQGNRTVGVVTGLIGLISDDTVGNMIVSFDESSILAIVSRMLMEEFKSVDTQVVDAVGELTNMISGGAKKDLAELGQQFQMATPVMIVGKGLELTQLSKEPTIQIPFTTAEGAFVVEANLSRRTR